MSKVVACFVKKGSTGARVNMAPHYYRDALALRDKLSPPKDDSRLPQGTLPDVDGGRKQALVTGMARINHIRPVRGKTAKPRPMYRPKDKAADAPLWGIYDYVTGHKLAQVRGDDLWALQQGGYVAQSQGGTLADIQVRPIAE